MLSTPVIAAIIKHAKRFKRAVLLVIMLQAVLPMYALRPYAADTLGSIEGRVVNDEGRPMAGISMRVMTANDSILRAGAVTDSIGNYRIAGLAAGNYVMSYSMVGYQKGFVNFSVTASRRAVSAPVLKIVPDDLMLNAAVVTASLPPVTVIEDAVSYNADASPTPEGSMVEDLIERIPGAEISDDGKITINGKEYGKVLVNGREFFGDDPQMALKNLPANIIKRIKTYDRKSEQARLTGIDDGVENNVIDLVIKPDLLKGLVGRASAAAGSDDRYSTALNVNRFRRDGQLSVMGGMNNINNPGFSEKGNDAMNFSRAARPGFTASKSAGITYAKDKKDRYRLSGNVRYGYTDAENSSLSHSETSYSDSSYRYNDGENHSGRRRNELSADFKLEWKIDTLTSLHVRPSFSYYKTDNRASGSSSAQRWNGRAEADTVDINQRLSHNASDSEGSNEGISLNASRRLSPAGRNVAVNASYGYSSSASNSHSRNITTYYLQMQRNRNYNRRSDADRFSMNYSVGATYSEPLFKGAFLQFRYNYSYRHARANRYGYQVEYARADSVGLDAPEVDWTVVPVDTSLSSCNENTYISHTFNLNMRHVSKKVNLSYGINVNPRHNATNYIFGPKMDKGLVTQDLLNWSPGLNFRYRFSKRTSLNVRYHGNSNEPDIENLQEVIDKTNPQNVRYGNPALKPSFTNRMEANFNHYGEKTRRSLSAGFRYAVVSNEVSNMSLYESSSGIRVSKLMNVDGRHSLRANLNFNTPLDSLQRFSLSTSTQMDMSDDVNYNSTPLTSNELLSAGIHADFQDLQPDDVDKLQAYALKNHTHSLRLRQNLQLRCRYETFSTGISAGLVYYKIDNSIRTANKRETFDYHLRATMQMDLPLNFQLASSINFTSRHGYSANIQKNIALWNARLSMRFLRKSAGLLTFQIFDILHQRSEVVRRISNLTITDTRSAALRDYFMIGFQYKINTMGGNRGKGSKRQRTQGARKARFSY